MTTGTQRKNVEDIYRLSPVQQGMLFHTLLAPETGVYFEQFGSRYGEGFDPDCFAEAWRWTVARHPVLRTSFLWEDLDEPVQVVHREVELPIERQDWRALPPEEQEERLQEYLAEDRRRGFRLDRPPLLRLALIRMADREYRVVWSYHHLLLDGWSVGLLMREVLQLYQGLSRREETALPERRPFRDYIRWLRAQDLDEAKEHWRRLLAGFREPTPLAVDRPAAGAEDLGYELIVHRMPRGDSARLKEFAQVHRLTLNSLVQGAFALLLSRYSGLGDVVFGVTLSGRPPTLPGVDAMIGCFINTLPFRARIDPDARVLPWLEGVQADQATLRKYEHVPLVDVQGAAEVGRDRELFESILVFESFTADADFEMSQSGSFQRTNYPLTVVASPGDQMSLRVGFELARFDAAEMERLLAHLSTLLATLPEDPQRRLRDVSLVAAGERRQALERWNRPDADFRTGRAVHQLFAEHAALRPDRVALTFEDRTVSYGALAAAAARLARRLVREGAGRETRIGLCVDRSVEMVVGILGILQAGGAYVPMDPAAPEERLRFIVEDSGASLVVTAEARAGALPATTRRVLVSGLEAAGARAEQDAAADEPVAPDELAYVIYTSGSTGRPKGSLVRHGSVQRLLDATDDWFSFGPDDAWTLFHSYAFDFSVWELWGALAYGGRVAVVPYWVSRSPEACHDLLRRERITVLNQTPSAFKQLVAADAAAELAAGELALRTVIFGGEALELSSLAPWFARHGDRHPRLVNMYGITETTVHVTYRPLTGADLEGAGGSPVGVPIPDLQVHLLDPWMNLVPVGVPGEIHVGGEGLARGYLDRPALTAERFVPDPFAAEAGVPGPAGRRLYKAGDLARRLPGGELDFLGRVDQQVKVRGFRIEPGEIEAVLARHPDLAQTAVVVREDVPGERRLVAYVVPRPGSEPRLEELRDHAAAFLPDYMIPAAFVAIAELPLTVNGKLDRRVLPAPEGSGRVGPDAAYEAPATPTEELLASVWGEILGVEEVGRGDDFFELGGHSLLATRVASRLREVLGVEVPLRSLFEETTLGRAAALIDGLRRAGTERREMPIRRMPRDGPAPLSFAQERLWFLDRMEPESSAYNVPGALRLRGGLAVPALARSVGELVARHDALRTVFATEGGRPVQVVMPPDEVRHWAALPVVDLSGLAAGAREAGLAALARRQATLPFDLTRGPLLRTTLVRLSPGEHAVLMAIHHIVSDGWSLGIFVRELAAGYSAAVLRRPAPLPELAVQYPDFAAWQREWLRGEVLEDQLGFWRERLAGAPSVLALPTDRPRPPVQSYRGDVLATRLPGELTAGLRDLGRRRGATLYMLLMAAFKALLARYSGQDDLIVGSTIANRTHEEVQGLIGFFVNTLALRTDLSDDPSFAALVDRVRRENLGAYDHQDLPFEKLVEEVQPQRDLSRSPLFQVVMQLQNAPAERLELPGLTLEPILADSRTAKFDLILNLAEPGPDGQGLQAVWRYKTALFDRTTVRRMAAHLRVLLAAAVAEPDLPVSRLPTMTAAERHALLVEPAGEPGAGRPQGFEPVHGRFAAVAAARPHAIAVTSEGGSLSYGELERRVNRLAGVLRGMGVGREVPVALCLDRSADLVTAVLGVLAAGGAYVPLDPAYPQERLAFVLEDCRAPVVVTRDDLAGALPPRSPGARVLFLDRDVVSGDDEAAAPPAAEVSAADAAYVIYTSGSTGRPKGVPVTHGNLARLLTATDPWFRFGPDDVWTLFHSYAFDFSVWEIWGALAVGGRLVVVPYELGRSPEAFHRCLREEGVTVLNQTPSAFRQLVRADAAAPALEALRLVVFGGEALELAALAPWFSRYGDRRPRLVNMYGITETTVHVTYRPVGPADLEAGRGSVIGRPIPDLRLHLLDRRMTPVPAGPAAEVHVGGAGVARGYLECPGLTAERFVPDPFAGLPGRHPGDRLYKSGDLARHRYGGDHEYLGRIDHQVKVRGFRIELGEIEAAVAAHPEVAEAVVVAREGATAEAGARLVAYAVPAGGEAPGAAGLKAHVAARLPDYMVPAAFVFLDAVPLTANGKVDRKALPEPDSERPDLAQELIAPRDRLEELVAGLWQEEIGVEAVGVHDDFFDLGGNSLIGAVAVNRLQELLGEILHVVMIFDAPTVAETAAYLRRQHPRAVARLLGEDDGPAETSEEEAPPIEESMVAHVRELVREMPRFTVGPAGAEAPNPPAVFLLSAPRSGSTLLRVMLGGHPGLFAPPELELLSFHTMADRRAVFSDRDAFWLEGAIRAVMELEACGAEEARERIAAWEAEGRSTQAFYRWLQERLGDRLLVDKTPSYALRPDVLARAEAEFDGARYIHLVRHPYGMIRSFEEAKLDQIFFPAEHPFTRRRLAELIWLVSERNVRAFLEDVDPARWRRVRFEDLTRSPEAVLREVCGFLGLAYEERMAQPYRESRERMTDGIHAQSRMLGDVKFHQHSRVEAGVAERWREHYRRDFLGPVTWEAAAALGYEPLERRLAALEPTGWRPGEPLPLSFAQERLWFLDQLDPGTHTYNIPVAVRLVGRLDLAAFAAALEDVADRQASLRTTFTTVEGRPRQVIAEPGPLPLPVVDLSGLPDPVRRRAAERLAVADARRPFDLARGPLFRASLLRLAGEGGAGEHAALLGMHHVVSDGWSMGILVREVGSAYAARAAGRAPELPELPVQYADFAIWQRRTVSDETLDRQLRWWRDRLGGVPVLQLPTDRPRPGVQTFRGATRPFRQPSELAEGLRRVGQAAGATRYVTMLAAFQAFLARWAGQDDLSVGSPFANRGRSEIEDLVGFFVNTLVLRAELAGDPSFGELVERTRGAVREAFAHQDVPFERVVQEVQPDRSLAVPPLFQAMLTLQDQPVMEAVSVDALKLEPLDAPTAISKFDLTLTLVESRGRVAGQWVWNTDLFDASTIERLHRSFSTFAAGAAADPGQRLSEIPLLSPEERREILEEWNRPAVEYPEEGAAYAMVAAQAAATPDAVALQAEGRSVSYGELLRRADRLARRLAGAGVGPETVVAVAAERSPELIGGLLGVLATGGAYLPLDPGLPAERLAFMLADSGAACLLTRAELLDGPLDGVLAAAEASGGRRIPVLLLEAPDGSAPAVTALAPAPPPPTAAAYVLYTSGSTGRPKGVVVHQAALANRLRYAQAADMGPADAFLQKTTVSFDVSLLEIFGPLVSGGRTVLPRPGGEKDTAYLVELIARERVTQTSFPPTLLFGLLEEEGFRGLESLRTVITGGETVPPELPARFYEVLDAELLNRYGPTETTISVTSWRCRPQREARSLPIGRPTAKARIHVLDRRLRPVPAGVLGEIVVGGPGVARGYLGRPSRTAEAFVPDVVDTTPGARFYRTGDLARFRPDGALEFVGRADRQVKVRGFRVELGEIEAVLASHPAVREAAVVDLGEGVGKTLAAYLVAEDGASAGRPELQAWAEAELPAYMVPSHFVFLPELPVSATGKVDRAALPAPERPAAAGLTHEPPAGPVEGVVAAVWADVLERVPEGRLENFFDAGGHSLLATRVVSRLRAAFGVELPLRAIFEEPTVAGLARAIETLRRAAAGASAAPPLVPSARPRRGPAEMPLSFAQERLWFLERLVPGTAAFHMVTHLRLEGALDVPALAATLRALAQRHETLRTAFAVVDGSPVQRIEPAGALAPAVVDLAGLPAERREPALARLARAHAVRPFDLSRAPLARLALIRLGAREHRLLLALHHSMADGWSMGVLVRDVAALYGAAVRREEPRLDPLPIQYGDFARWQRSWLTADVLEAELDFWRRELAGAPPALELPTDRPRSTVQRFRGGYERVVLREAATEGLRRLARSTGATLFMVLLAALDALFARLSGQDDVLVGTPVAGRTRVETEGLIGFFLNNLVLRVRLDDDPSFEELVGRVREVTLRAFAHQDLPFEKLVEALTKERNLSQAPLFQHALVLQNAAGGRLDLPGLTLEQLDADTGTTRFDLSLALAEGDGVLSGRMFFNRDLYDRETVRRMLGWLETLLAAALEAPERRVTALSLLTDAERGELLTWNRTAVGHPRPARLDELIVEQARATPDAVAVSAGGRSLTYGELDRRSAALALRLRDLGVGPDVLVGVCAERSLELLVAVVGVVRSGGAYVPLDQSYPEDRLAFMVEDSAAPVLLVQEGLAGRLPASQARELALEDIPAGPAAAAPVPSGAGDEALAYVIYTSGSTGRPKGAGNAHRGVVNRLLWMQETYGLDASDVVVQKTPFSFDVSVWELFWPLLAGARLVMAAPESHKDPGHLAEIVRRERVTTIHFVPSMLQVFLEAPGVEECRSLRRVIASGEALPFDLVERHHRRLEAPLHNLYGPTEAAVDVTWWPTRPGDHRRLVPIGRPVANTRIHLADPRMAEVPVGVAGELLIAGVQVARGYHGRPALTAERFVPDPWAPALGGAGARLYRTGDLARRLADGSIDYLGRIDHQVKLRGFRIELGEVEAALTAHPGVREAVVVVRGSAADRHLAAYVVPAGDGAPEIEALRRSIAERLPDHMVPSRVVVLDEMPLSPNGKVDRKRLPELEVDRAEEGVRWVAPRTPTEELVAEMWAERLGRERLSVTEDFFAAGGNSLAAAVFVNRLQERLGEIVHVVSLFDRPTVEGYARYLDEEYPDALARLVGGDPAPAAGRPADDAAVTVADLSHLERLVPPRPLSAAEEAAAAEGDKNPPAVFVLAPPRSGTTLLRVMLAGHPRLFAPPELELLRYRTLGERRDAFAGRDAFRLEGLVRAVMEAHGCGVDEARAAVAELEERNAGVGEAYRLLQEWIGDRLLVDKTPTYAWSRSTLDAAEALFHEPKYLLLVRHPRAVVRSFEEARLDQIFFRHDHPFTRRQLGELLWTASHRNVDRFFATLPPERCLRVRFEELVREPEAELRRIASFLGLEYHPDMARPYDGGSRRMTDGLHEASRMIGDVKFHQHRGIDASAAEAWRTDQAGAPLGEPARRVMRRLGIDRELAAVDRSARVGTVLPSEIVGLRGGGDDSPLFLVHPVAGDVYFYRDLVRALPAGRAVYGFQAPGLDGREEPLETVEALAERYVDALVALRPEGPYLLAGSSLGGTVAYEMAQRLRAEGREVLFLGMVDTPGVRQLPTPFRGAEAEAMVLGYFAGGAGVERMEALETLTPEERPGYMLRELERAGRLREGLGEDDLARLVRVIRTNQAAMIAYRPRPYDGAVIFFRAEDGGARFDEPREEPWRPLVRGGLSVRVAPGNHLSMNLPPHAARLARALHEELERVAAGGRAVAVAVDAE